jgi:hypothetical protein
MEADQWVLAQDDVIDAQISHLLDPCPGVVEEQHQGPVAQGQPPPAREMSKQVLDLIPRVDSSETSA